MTIIERYAQKILNVDAELRLDANWIERFNAGENVVGDLECCLQDITLNRAKKRYYTKQLEAAREIQYGIG